MPVAMTKQDRDWAMEEDIRTVKSFAKLKANKKRFAQVKKAVKEEVALMAAELGKKPPA